MAMLSLTVHAQVPPEYQVAPWHGFSQCAITYSFDDLTGNQLPVAIPMFDRYNVKATLNIVTDWVKPDEWAKLSEVGKRGHEIASHTISHPNLTEKSDEEFEAQQRDSKKTLEERTGLQVTTMVYPYCASNREDITAKYYIGARICDGRVEPHTPGDMMRISSKGVGGPYSGFDNAQAFNKWVDEGARDKGWCTFLIHGIDDDGGYAPIKSSELESHIKYVVGQPQKFWPATFNQVCKYIMERDALAITENQGKKAISIQVECKASSPITDLSEPVTISRALPSGWKDASVRSGKQKVKSRVSNGKVIFDVIPGQSYQISKK